MQKPEYKYENTSVYVVLRLRTSVTKSHLQAKVTSLGYTMQKHRHFGKGAIVKMKYVSNVWNCEWNRGRLGKKVQKHMYMSGPILYHFLLYKSLSLCCIISSSSHPKSFKNAPRSHIIRFRTFFLAPFDTFCFCIRGPWVSGPCNSEFLQRFYFLMIPVHQWSHNPSFVAVTEIFISFIIYVILIIIITRPKAGLQIVANDH